MNTAHDQLRAIERLGAQQFSATSLASSHSGVARRVRVHRVARVSATSVAGVGMIAAGAWGASALIDRSDDMSTPGASTPATTTGTVSATPSPPAIELVSVEFSEGGILVDWAQEAATTLGVDQQALLDALAAAAPGDAEPEGWIKPGEYQLAAGSTVDEIAQALVGQRVAQLETLGVPQEQWQEVITKASIVQAEARRAEDMPGIAAFVGNRLELGMALEVQSPLDYVLRPDLNTVSDDGYLIDSPYNVFMYAGLPPSAINSPSDGAIDAVLNPADEDWLYFMVVNPDTGETRFGTTFEQHSANYELLLEWQAQQDAA